MRGMSHRSRSPGVAENRTCFEILIQSTKSAHRSQVTNSRALKTSLQDVCPKKIRYPCCELVI